MTKKTQKKQDRISAQKPKKETGKVPIDKAHYPLITSGVEQVNNAKIQLADRRREYLAREADMLATTKRIEAALSDQIRSIAVSMKLDPDQWVLDLSTMAFIPRGRA